jgi:spore coat protein CotH
MHISSIWRPLSLAGALIVLLGLLATPAGRAQLSTQPTFRPAVQSAGQVFLPAVMCNHPPDAVPLYRLAADPDDLAWLADNYLTDEYIPAVFAFEGENHAVDVRYRGDVSRHFPKKSWKIRFAATDRFGEGTGQRRLNLNAEYSDQSLLREYLAYDFLARVGVLAPQADFVRLEIDGETKGLFTRVEQVDKLFLHRRGFDVQGNLYEANYGNLARLDSAWEYRYYYDKKANAKGGDAYHDLHALATLISDTPVDGFPQAIAAVLDVDGWLDWYAATILLGDFEFVEKDYYLYHDFHTDRWHIVPWDFDMTFGHNWRGSLDTEVRWDNPIDSGTSRSRKFDDKWNMLVDRMMGAPEFRWHHGRRLMDMMADEFSEAEMFSRIDAAHALIRAAGLADPHRWGGEGDFLAGPDELKTYVTNRRAYLYAVVGDFMPDLPVPLVINEFMAANESTLADEAGEFDDWIEIHNTGLASLDVGGMYLTDDLSDPLKWRIPDGTVIPGGGHVVIWADNDLAQGPLHTTFKLKADDGAIGLFDKDTFGQGQIDALTYGAQAADLSYGRTTDGGETWGTLDAPTPGWSNLGRPPVINGVAHAPVEPEADQPVTVTAAITDDRAIISVALRYNAGVVVGEAAALEEGEAGPATTVRYQASVSEAEIAMYDDGAHGDGAADDGVYGATIPGLAHGARVDYYVTATDDAGMTTTARRDQPWLAYVDPEIAPIVRYVYQVGYHRPPLYINEFLALNRDGLQDEAGNEDDWIELYNAGDTDLEVGGMHVSDALRWPSWWAIPDGTVVSAHGYALVWADEELDEGPLHASFALSGEGERVTLYDSHAHGFGFIDAVYFGPQQSDVSYGRHPDGGETRGAMPPTPGEANQLMPPAIADVRHSPAYPTATDTVTVKAKVTDDGAAAGVRLSYDAGSGGQVVPMAPQGGDAYAAQIPARPNGTWVGYFVEAADDAGLTATHPPGAPATVHRYLVGYTPPTVAINEFLADNASADQDEAGEFEDWVELYNWGDVTLDVGGMYLTDDLTAPTAWRLPGGTQIPAHGYLLIWCDKEGGEGPLHASFKLDKSGEEIGLLATDAWGNLLVDSVVFNAQATDVSLGRVPDGGGRWQPLDPPTPGAAN